MVRWAFRLAVIAVLIPLAWRTYKLQGVSAFTEDDIPNLDGKVAIVTGANTGMGFETARALAEHGATVLLGCRDKKKCQAAADRINEKRKGSASCPATLDLSDAQSIEAFAESVKKYKKIDFLVNNGAVMNIPEARNGAGIEMTLATNHIGHYLLTGHLLALLKNAKGRIVNHSSSASADFVYKLFHGFESSDSAMPWSGVNMSDLNWEHRPYDTYAAYAQSKRANLFFTHELNARFGADGITATACEPGGAATDLQVKATGMSETARQALIGQQPFFATAAAGALMQTYATVRAKADEVIVPLWPGFGPPVVGGTSMSHLMLMYPVSYRKEEAKQLWEQSAKLTGMAY